MEPTYEQLKARVAEYETAYVHGHFNELSPGELERLALLAEECAEVIQVVGKILRHGYTSTHPNDPDGENNRELLEEELGHVQAAQSLMIDKDDLSESSIKAHHKLKRAKVNEYLHHNIS